MAIVSVQEITGAQAALNEKFERTYTRKFRVITDSALVGAAAVGNAVPPVIGSSYLTATESDLGAFCNSIQPVQDSDNPRVWEVTVEYGPQEPGDENPLNRPLEISWSFAQFTRVCDRDINGHALLNSAGDFFDPPPEIDDSRPVLTIVRNEASFDPAQAIDYQDAVNSDSFLGFAAGTAKVMGISSSLQFESNIFFWKTSYEFQFRRDGWKLSVLDQGRYKTNHKPIPEKDSGGNDMVGTHVSDPVPLDGSGNPLTNPTPSTAVFREFDVYKQRAFSAFNF